MLETLLDLYDNHPHEDSLTVSLMVVGILKVSAVLKSVSVCVQLDLQYEVW
jgi:hypothetical protein